MKYIPLVKKFTYFVLYNLGEKREAAILHIPAHLAQNSCTINHVDHTERLLYNICIVSTKKYVRKEQMKTTLDLPVNLLEEAMRVGKCGTKTATIIRALEQMVRSVKLSRLRAMRGTMPDFSLDLDALRART